MGCYDVANPYRPGQIGYDGASLANGDQVFARVYPGASADKAGIREGDVLLVNALPPKQQFELNLRRSGQQLDLPVSRNGKRLNFHITTGTTENFRPIEFGPLELLLLLVFAATGTLVALRGAPRREVRALALFFIAWAWRDAFSWFFNVAPTPALAFIGAMGAPAQGQSQGIGQAFVAYYLLRFVGHFPPVRSRVRSTIAASALPVAVVMAIVGLWSLASSWHADWQVFQIAATASYTWIDSLLTLALFPLLVLIAAIDGLMHVDGEHRLQMRWVGSALIVSTIPAFFQAAYALTGPFPPPLSTWFGIFGDVPLLLIAYAILRHRIIDVSIVVSRAAIFGVVSLAVVILVAALEWTLGQVLDRGVGAEAANGAAGQALRLAVAVGVGLSAVPILRLVERWLNAVFFGKREQALAELRRFALEADVVTNSASLLSLACDSLRDNVECRYAAVYVSENGAYKRVRSSDDSPPPALGQDDSAILRLRRWNEPFEMNVGVHSLSEALMLPMSIGGSLLGVIVCGPKHERTHYLAEEVEALSLVAQRVGTALYVLLQREGQVVRSDRPLTRDRQGA